MLEDHRQNHIPFGLDPDDGSLVDVENVPRGAKCGCVCPSCKTPLIARQGKEKEWHFAHASRRNYERTKNECRYSFFVSIRLMARQIIGDEITMRLPEYRGTVAHQSDRLGYPLSASFLITEAKEIVISNVAVEARFEGIPVDIAGQVNGFRFVVYFTHPGRNIPPELDAINDSRCGIIAVALDDLDKTMFRGERDQRRSYRSILREFLINDLESKQWVYHPRYRRCHQQALQELEAKAESIVDKHATQGHRPRASLAAPSPGHDVDAYAYPRKASGKRVLFECMMCKSQWQGVEPSGSACPQCQTHLFRTCVKVLGDDTAE